MKISKYIIQQITSYLIKEYDKLFIIFNLYSVVKLKIIILPLIVILL